MKDKRNINVLVCFFLTYDRQLYMTEDFFSPEENGINRHTSFLPDYESIEDIASYNDKI